MDLDIIYCRGRNCEKTTELNGVLEASLGGGFNRREALKYHEWAREDAYGIFTGHYCDDCYENNYPYRKDRYPTMENDGMGDYLNDDY